MHSDTKHSHSLIKPTINPMLESVLDKGGMKGMKLNVGFININVGNFINNLIEFFIIAFAIISFVKMIDKFM